MLQWLDDLLRNLDIGVKFVWLTNPKTLVGGVGALLGLWFTNECLKAIREAKAQGTAVPAGARVGIIVGGIFVSAMIIIILIGLAEHYPNK